MSRERIIMVMIEPPLPWGNASARWFFILLRGLVERGYDVTAFAACGNPADIEEVKKFFPSPGYDLRCYPYPKRGGISAKWQTLRRPYSYVFSPELCRDLDGELRNGFDILQLEHLWCGWLGGRYAGKALLNIHYLYEIDLADVAPRGFYDRAIRYATRFAERRLIRQYPKISTFTPRLSARVKEISPASDVHTVPLGLDLSLYQFRERSVSNHNPTVGLIGSFDWYPTYSAGVRLMTRLWPEIKRRVPSAKLQIAGRRARTALKRFHGITDVAIYEDVPDILPYFDSTDVLLYAPSKGSGIKVKVLESFALGTPVVTTREGVEGIPAVDKVHAGVCDDDAELIDRTVTLLKNPGSRQEQRLAARALVEEHYCPNVVLDELEHAYDMMHRNSIP